MDRPPHFLSINDVLILHAIAMEDQGADAGIRDRALLESAIALPAQQYDGAFLHPTIPDMAAAYAYHICSNHPFLDGNKRAAFGAMLAFLLDNGWHLELTFDDAVSVMLQLAAGTIDKATFTQRVHHHARWLRDEA